MASSIQNPMEKARICRPVWSTKMVCLSALCGATFFLFIIPFLGRYYKVLVDCLAVTIKPYGLRI